MRRLKSSIVPLSAHQVGRVKGIQVVCMIRLARHKRGPAAKIVSVEVKLIHCPGVHLQSSGISMILWSSHQTKTIDHPCFQETAHRESEDDERPAGDDHHRPDESRASGPHRRHCACGVQLGRSSTPRVRARTLDFNVFSVRCTPL